MSERFTLALEGGAGGPRHIPGDYLCHDGVGRSFRDGAWGILRVLDTPSPDLQALPGITPAVPEPVCPPGAPACHFQVSAVDLPSGDWGGGEQGRKAAFVHPLESLIKEQRNDGTQAITRNRTDHLPVHRRRTGATL